MGAILHVDHPTEHVLDEAIARISGWWHREKPGGGVGLRIADRPIEWITVDRPDVTRVYPRRRVPTDFAFCSICRNILIFAVEKH